MDFYCERLSAAPWAEPLNAVSNLGFLLAAWWCWRILPAKAPEAAGAVRGLSVLLACVGLASLGFHTFQSRLTGLLDVAFIGLFNVCYLVLFAYLVLAWRAALAATAGFAFLALDQLRAAILPAGALYGSTMYFPPLLVLLVLAALARTRHAAGAAVMLQAALLFAVSLTARTLDRPLCAVWPYGLHFIWHLLNAVVLLQLIRAFAGSAGRVPSAGVQRRGMRHPV